MRGMGFSKGMMGKGAVAKGGMAKGFFGFIGGVFKFLFFGFFLIMLLIVGLIAYFALKRKISQNRTQNFNYNSKSNEDIIDAEVIEEKYPIKK